MDHCRPPIDVNGYTIRIIADNLSPFVYLCARARADRVPDIISLFLGLKRSIKEDPATRWGKYKMRKALKIRSIFKLYFLLRFYENSDD